MNLLGNAIKFSDGGEVSISCQQIADQQSKQSTAGNHHYRPRHWHDQRRTCQRILPFAQGDSSSSRRFSGIGLGLAITQQLCRQMGGDLTATSTPGQGSSFTARVNFDTTEQPSSQPAAHILPEQIVVIISTRQSLHDQMSSHLTGFSGQLFISLIQKIRSEP